MELLKGLNEHRKGCKVAVRRVNCRKAAVYAGSVRYSTEPSPLVGTTNDMRCDDMS